MARHRILETEVCQCGQNMRIILHDNAAGLNNSLRQLLWQQTQAHHRCTPEALPQTQRHGSTVGHLTPIYHGPPIWCQFCSTMIRPPNTGAQTKLHFCITDIVCSVATREELMSRCIMHDKSDEHQELDGTPEARNKSPPRSKRRTDNF